MRIAYVINSVEGGGAALPIPAIMEVLRDGGADVKIFALTRRDGRAIPAIVEAGLDLAVREGGESDHLAALHWLETAISGWRPTHIWTSLTRATLLGQRVGRRLGIPVVSWQHAAYLKPANLALLRWQRRLSRLWIADSHSVAQLTVRRLHVPETRLALWPLFAADPGAPRGRPWQAGQPIRLGSLGRLHPVKGYDVLIAALAKLKTGGFESPSSYEVVIAGEGMERAALDAALKAANLPTVTFAGFVDKPRAFLAGLHLYVQPSRSEGLCIAAHEAMQAGLGVVASHVGELPFSIEPGRTGAVVPPGDADALADALAKLLANPQNLYSIGLRSRRNVLDRFGKEMFVARGQAIVERLKQST